MEKMTTYYQDSAVYVGSAEMEVEDRAYRLDDLQLVWHQRGPRGAHGVGIILARLVLIVAAVVALATGGWALRRVDLMQYSGGMVLAGAVLAIVLMGTVGLFVVEGVITLIERSYEKGTVEHQIWARVFNNDVLLFSTRDKLKFGKIYRALQRAIEHSEVH
jgi:Family of unknown function (DUF6232)